MNLDKPEVTPSHTHVLSFTALTVYSVIRKTQFLVIDPSSTKGFIWVANMAWMKHSPSETMALYLSPGVPTFLVERHWMRVKC